MSTIWSRLTALAYGSVASATLATLLADQFWLLELFSHFRVQYVAVMLVLLALLATAGRWLGAAVLMPFLVLNIVPLWAYLSAVQPGPEATSTVTLASINLNSRNEETQRLLELLASEQPDVVLLQEITPRWARAIAPLEKRYRHRILAPRGGNFGIGLLSVYPIVAHQIVALGDSGYPALVATLQLGARQLNLIGAHPVPPMSASSAALRNQQLAQLAELAADAERPLAVLGDFNSTPWSPYLQRLLERSQLRDAAQGRGLDFTWPTFMPLLGIPIDHCLVSVDLTVVGQHRGPSIGSDHYPLFTQLRW